MSDPDVELTVIVPTHNRADIIEDTLGALAEQQWTDGSWRVLVVDNDSTDATPEILERAAAILPVAVEIIAARDDHSPAHARNAGARHASSENLAFVDDDDLIGPGWVAAIGTALRTHPLVGSRFDYRRLNDDALARHRGSFQTTRLGEVFGVPVVSSGGLGCRRSLWLELDGQDETLGYGGEDTEFALRANLHGTPPVWCEDALYHVRLRGGASTSFTQGRRFGRSRVRLYTRHGAAFGVRPQPLTAWVRRLAGLVLRLPSLRSPGPRLVWFWQLGQRIGHLQGSAADRTWYP